MKFNFICIKASVEYASSYLLALVPTNSRCECTTQSPCERPQPEEHAVPQVILSDKSRQPMAASQAKRGHLIFTPHSCEGEKSL